MDQNPGYIYVSANNVMTFWISNHVATNVRSEIGMMVLVVFNVQIHLIVLIIPMVCT